jgi:hypothetical protein
VTWARGYTRPTTSAHEESVLTAPSITTAHNPSSFSIELDGQMSPELTSPFSLRRKTLLWSDEECPVLTDSTGRLGSEQSSMVDAIRKLSFDQ